MIEATPNASKITLPNMNAAPDSVSEQGSAVTSQMQKVLSFITEHGQITDAEVQSLLGIKKTRAFTLIKQMREMGLVQMLGRGEEKRYTVK